MRYLVWMLVLSAITGCAAMDAEKRREGLIASRASIAAAKPCCSDFSQIRYAPISMATAIDVEINRKSPAFSFDTGKSFFHAFELPVFHAPYTIEIVSRLDSADSTALTVGESWLFCPVLLLLDEGRKPIARIRESWPIRAGWSDGPRIGAKADVTGALRGARYLIVFTEPRLAMDEVEFPGGGGLTMIPGPGVPLFVNLPRRANYIPFNYEGRVEVRLVPSNAPQ